MTALSDDREMLEEERQKLKKQLFYQEDYLRRLKSRSETEQIGIVEAEIESTREQLAEIERQLQPSPLPMKATKMIEPGPKDPQGSLDKSVVMVLVVASSVFAGLLFAIVATFKWAMGRNMDPVDFVILTPVAVILALVLFPFILVLLNRFSPQMAQEQFNRLHDFAEASFPALLHWLNRFSRFFRPPTSEE